MALVAAVNSEIHASAATLTTAVISTNGASEHELLRGDIKRLATAESPGPTVEWFSDEELAELRELFLEAEQALQQRRDNEYFQLADQLKGYPLYPYLQYQWLKRNLGRDRQIKHFLSEHESSRYADILRSRWLKSLARNGKWSTYLEYYRDTTDRAMQCNYQRARYRDGDKQQALEAASELWQAGFSQPSECDPLFETFMASPMFTQDVKWSRFQAALINNKASLAIYVKKKMAPEYQHTAQTWLNLHRYPSRHIDSFLKSSIDSENSQLAANMFSHAISRLAGKDVHRAAELWDDNRSRYQPDQQTVNRIEKRLAMRMALQREDGAFERFGQVSDHDTSSRTWRVRAALQEQDWDKVIVALDALEPAEKQQDRWLYWQARAYLETGQADKAQPLLHDLAEERSFYGYMAADRIDSMYRLAADPVVVSVEDMAALKAKPEFRVAHEFMVLERINDAKLQWWHAVKRLSDSELVVAAKLAQQWQWHEIAIFTIAKARHWDDIDIRFPLSYTENIYKNSEKNDLNPAIVFGLIRRESAFNERAYSPAGARGLMQIMPATGKRIARDFKERWRGSKSLYQPVTNIRYGSYYYRKLLKQFDGNYAIALAAYNAGPNRVKTWLPVDESLPADIWIETIPFRETREYVVNVLAYALIYQMRGEFGEDAEDLLTMTDLARDVAPLD